MSLSAEGRAALVLREGKRNKAYLDTKGIPTIGVGHTAPEVYLGLVWTDKQVEDALSKDVKWAEAEVDALHVPLSTNQYDALVSFIFNIGAEAFKKSTMRKHLVVGNYEAAAKEFLRWNIPKEIIGRRTTELKQFLA